MRTATPITFWSKRVLAHYPSLDALQLDDPSSTKMP